MPSRSVAVEGMICPSPAADSGVGPGDHVGAAGALEEDHRLERVGVHAVASRAAASICGRHCSVRSADATTPPGLFS